MKQRPIAILAGSLLIPALVHAQSQPASSPPAPPSEPATPAPPEPPKAQQPKPSPKPDAKPQPAKPTVELFASGGSWRGEWMKTEKNATARITERSVEKGTARIELDPDGKAKYILEVRVDPKGTRHAVTHATLKVKGGRTEGDSKPELWVWIDRDGSMHISGSAHFHTRKVNERVFQFDFVGRPPEAKAPENDAEQGKGKGKKGKRGGKAD